MIRPNWTTFYLIGKVNIVLGRLLSVFTFLHLVSETLNVTLCYCFVGNQNHLLIHCGSVMEILSQSNLTKLISTFLRGDNKQHCENMTNNTGLDIYQSYS